MSAVTEELRETVFLVDDDPLALRSLLRLLELETPYRVRSFSDGAEALAAVKEERPDLILTDLTMPGMGGLELLRRVRDVHPDCARVVLTGYADKDSAVRAINDAAIYQYVEKPWDNEALLTTVRQALEHVALTRTLRATVAALQAKNAALEQAMAQLKDAQERLVAAERLAAVGRLASGIAHEIGNQLSLLGYAELIADRYRDDPEAHELTEPLLAARRRMATMVSSIKEFVRGTGTNYPKTRVPLTVVVDEALSVMRFEPALKVRTLTRDPNDPEAFAVVNREKLLQVLLNLMKNAIQATQEGGHIRIGVERHGREVVLFIEDNGMGIDPKDLPRIWEPFFTTKGDAGTGLGLGICRRIVEEHGGRIEVESTLGERTRFTVTLPAA